MKRFLAVILILIFNVSIVTAEVKIGFVEIQKILKNAPQTVSANKK
ncbi:MAG: Skp family chaperone for outer membrane protein, partial [Methylophilaceae bacterium]